MAAESRTGEGESSGGGESSSSTGGELEICAHELGLHANGDSTTLAEGIEASGPQHKL